MKPASLTTIFNITAGFDLSRKEFEKINLIYKINQISLKKYFAFTYFL